MATVCTPLTADSAVYTADTLSLTADQTEVCVEVRPTGGWLYHPLLRRIRDEEEEQPQPVVQAVEAPKPAGAKPPKARTLHVPSRPDFSSVKDAAYRAYLQEFSSLVAKEAARKAKRRRAATLLLLM